MNDFFSFLTIFSKYLKINEMFQILYMFFVTRFNMTLENFLGAITW